MTGDFWGSAFVFGGVVVTAAANTYLQIRNNKVVKQVHTLVNSRMGAQLGFTATALRRIADMTKNKKDEEAATQAEKLLEEHTEKQAIVDASK